jgi:signal transduction histidine kinase
MAAVERRERVAAETVFTALDGRRIEALFTVCWPTEHQGRGNVLVGVIDITARKQAETELRQSELRYRSLFQHMPIAMWQMKTGTMRDALADLRQRGIADLKAYAAQQPQFLDWVITQLQVVDVNDRAVEMLGASSRDDLLGTFSRLWSNRDALLHVVEARLGGAESFTLEATIDTHDGRKIDVLTSVAFPEELSREGFNQAGMIDITDRSLAKAALEQSEERYRHLFHYMPISMWQLDSSALAGFFRDFRASGVTDLAAHLEANPHLLRKMMDSIPAVLVNDHTVALFSGTSVQDFAGNPIARHWGSNPGTIIRSFAARYNGEPGYSEETVVRTLDGRDIDVQFNITFATPLADKGISLVGVVDIGDRVRALTDLRKSETRYRALFHAMPVGLAQLDMRGLIEICDRITASGVTDLATHVATDPDFLDQVLATISPIEVNAECMKLFGAQTREEMLKPITWVWQARPDTIRRSILARLRGDLSFSEETKVNTLDGGVVDVLYTINFAPDVMERGTNIVGFVNITDRIAAQTKLEQLHTDFAHASRVSTLGELTASIAHEVNQPLTAIAIGGETALRWLSRSDPDLDEVRDLAERIVVDARRAAGIISRIGDMARNRAPQHALFSVNDVIKEAVAFLETELRLRNVTVYLNLDATAPMVLCDRIQIQQVIANLVINASQAMTDARTSRPSIWLTTRATASHVEIAVQDNGPGLPETGVDQLFQGFVSTKVGGLGIGLSICRTIIDAHGGTISGTNSPEGGAKFEFTLLFGDEA